MPHMSNLPWLQFLLASNLISFYIMYNTKTNMPKNTTMNLKKTFLNKKW